jgi:GNAT superfamily N-acetyltransferase
LLRQPGPRAGGGAEIAGAGADHEARARAWLHAAHAAVCDVIEPWEHGTVVRASRFPGYWDFNTVRVEDDPGLSADELVSFADEALAGLDHRRVDFEEVAAADRLRPDFEALGWKATRLVWMRHDGSPPRGGGLVVGQVPYDAVRDLREQWIRQDFPDVDLKGYFEEDREVAMTRGAEVFAVVEGGAPVAFTQLERVGEDAEITDVYVHPDHRGKGLGTALTTAAIEAAGDVRDLWISADDEGRPKELYARLGFRPVWTTVDFLRQPPSPAAGSGTTISPKS